MESGDAGRSGDASGNSIESSNEGLSGGERNGFRGEERPVLGKGVSGDQHDSGRMKRAVGEMMIDGEVEAVIGPEKVARREVGAREDCCGSREGMGIVRVAGRGRDGCISSSSEVLDWGNWDGDKCRCFVKKRATNRWLPVFI